MFFILDDNPRRIDDFIEEYGDVESATYVGQAIKMLGEKVYDLVSLDHDLLPHHYNPHWNNPNHRNDPNHIHDTAACLGQGAGCDIAKFIASLPPEKRPKKIVIHSWNRPAAVSMGRILLAAGIRVILSKARVC